jgi:Xaa-Pro aminopeptidase
MLTESGCVQRRQNLWKQLPNTIEWVLIGDARHIQYFCGFRVNPVSFSADQPAALLLFRDGQSVLLADNFTRRTASADLFVSREVIEPWYDHQHSVTNRHHALAAAVRTEISRLDTRSGLIEVEAVSVNLGNVIGDTAGAVTLDGINTTLGTVIRELRRSKLPDEVALMKQCMDAGRVGQIAAFDVVRSGASELDVYLAIQWAVQQAAQQASVLYGDFRATNSAVFKAGGLPTGYRLQEGDLMLLDFSVVISGYRSDFTNTIAIGRPSAAQTAQADACIAALQAAEQHLVPDAACSDVFAAAEAVLVDRGFPGLSHHAGHGLGMEHPEPPILVPHSTDKLQIGDVVTLEPGLYQEGTGGMRFEHNYLVTESGSERLSHHHLGLEHP